MLATLTTSQSTDRSCYNIKSYNLTVGYNKCYVINWVTVLFLSFYLCLTALYSQNLIPYA